LCHTKVSKCQSHNWSLDFIPRRGWVTKCCTLPTSHHDIPLNGNTCWKCHVLASPVFTRYHHSHSRVYLWLVTISHANVHVTIRDSCYCAVPLATCFPEHPRNPSPGLETSSSVERPIFPYPILVPSSVSGCVCV